MDLIIVESPTKARTLSRFLGDGYSVEATMGHIKDLPKSQLSIDVEHNFKPDYVFIEKKKDAVDKILKSAKKAKMIYIATDPDREGEAIAQHVKEILSDKNTKISKKDKKKHSISRIVFHEITKEAVEDAIANPKTVDKNLVDAQIARRVLDRLVGYKLSPLLWKKVRRGLSAGRVQSVAVRLIVEREREIEKFRPDEYWEIYCVLKTKNPKHKDDQFIVQLIKVNDKKAEVKDEKTAKQITADLEKSGYKVLDIRKKEVRKNPYPPFTTSTMTQAGARIFGWSAKKTMSVAQSLYEEGLITYHRTDSVNLANTAVEKARSFIKEKYGDSYLPDTPRFYKTTSKVAQEAHEAIRPTNIHVQQAASSKKFGDTVERLYDLIWRRFVSCQMTQSIYDETTIDVQALGTRQQAIERTNAKSLLPIAYLLRASGQIMKFDGWRKVFGGKKVVEEVVQLPEVVKDESLHLIKVDPKQKFTEPPARYNEASLIKTLEKLGIGRPSTYAPIISTIQIRSYVEKNEGKFTPTPVGTSVVDFLLKNFPDVFEYSFTAGMEDDLDNIANGKREWEKMMGEFFKPFEKKLEYVEKHAKRVKIPVEKLGKKCPKCEKGELVIRTGRFGKFISCSLFPDCDFTEKYLEKIGMKCPDCKEGDVIIKPTRKGRKFFGCSRYPECKFASWKKPGQEEVKPQTEVSK